MIYRPLAQERGVAVLTALPFGRGRPSDPLTGSVRSTIRTAPGSGWIPFPKRVAHAWVNSAPKMRMMAE